MAIVGRISDVPEGSIQGFDIAGQRIGIAQSDGDFFAFDVICTHEECDLEEEGEIEGSELTCLCHFTVFNLHSGEVVDGPAADPLPMFDVLVTDGDLEVTI